jgi:hypothetical protein
MTEISSPFVKTRASWPKQPRQSAFALGTPDTGYELARQNTDNRVVTESALRESDIATCSISVLLHPGVFPISTCEHLGLRSVSFRWTYTRRARCDVSILVDKFEVVPREQVRDCCEELHVLRNTQDLCETLATGQNMENRQVNLLLRGSWIKYSFLHSFGLVTCAGIKGYMKVSKLGRHHCANVSPTTHSSLTPSPVNWVPTGARRSFSLALKPSISSSSARR